ncbi:MAG TPA: sulfite exporter TauE/SafE family protein [Candidatus Methanomethylicus sp.]|nr:sulfite exporter TauE/SafE family protein [Candidatus Methanomethylicus sp.]HRU81208.1 sulfite exporter TauE/SafE family protein [Candidatus Methanomethylicus sp.]
MDLPVIIATFAFGMFAGSIGTMLGLGGGVLMIIFFIIGLNLPAQQAVALSLLAVIASSSMGGSVYIRDKMTNLKLAMILETCTVTGAVIGALLAMMMPVSAIQLLLGAVLIYAAATMIKGVREAETPALPVKGLTVKGEYTDECTKMRVCYTVIRMKLGLFLSLIAGVVSGLVGIGGGVIMVPIMNLAMKIPMKAAAATSNFMVGVTAAASAFVYFKQGYVDLYMAVPSVLGIMVGAYAGTLMMGKMRSNMLRRMLGFILAFFALVLFMKAAGVLSW